MRLLHLLTALFLSALLGPAVAKPSFFAYMGDGSQAYIAAAAPISDAVIIGGAQTDFVDRVAQAVATDEKIIVALHDVVFRLNELNLREDWQTRVDAVLQKLGPHTSRVFMFYLVDEPYWNNYHQLKLPAATVRANVQTVASYLKSKSSAYKTFINYSHMELFFAGFWMDMWQTQNIDYVSVTCFVTDPEGCSESNIRYNHQLLLENKTPAMKLVLVGDGAIVTPYTPALDAERERRFRLTKELAENPEVIGIGVFYLYIQNFAPWSPVSSLPVTFSAMKDYYAWMHPQKPTCQVWTRTPTSIPGEIPVMVVTSLHATSLSYRVAGGPVVNAPLNFWAYFNVPSTTSAVVTVVGPGGTGVCSHTQTVN